LSSSFACNVASFWIPSDDVTHTHTHTHIRHSWQLASYSCCIIPDDEICCQLVAQQRYKKCNFCSFT